jgi:hypothetical protein
MSSYTTLWTQETCAWHVKEGFQGRPLDHTASNQFRSRGLTAGDRIFALATRDGAVILVGALTVEKVVSYEEAKKQLGYDPWVADDHLLARPGTGTPMDFDNVLPLHVVRDLEFVSGKSSKRLKFRSEGKVDRQTLRSVRELSPASALSLEARLSTET